MKNVIELEFGDGFHLGFLFLSLLYAENDILNVSMLNKKTGTTCENQSYGFIIKIGFWMSLMFHSLLDENSMP